MMFKSILASALALSLTACAGAGSAGGPASKDADKPSSVSIKFWHYWDGKNGEVMSSLVDDWNKDHPEVQVEDVFIGFDDLLPKLQTATAGGEGPALAAGDQIWVPTLSKSGRLVAVGDAVDTSRFFPEMLKPGARDGAQYSVPVSSNNLQLFINKDLFKKAGLNPDQPPATWDELQEQAAKCTDASAGVQGMELFTEPGEGLTWQYQVYLWQAGGEFLNEDGSAAAFNTPEGVAALGQLLKLIESKSSTVAAWGAFGQGKACMVMDGSWMVGIWSDEPPFDFSTAALPLPAEGKAATNMGGEQLFVLTQDEAEQQAAFEFIDYLTSNDIQSRWDQETGFTPVLPALAEDAEYRAHVEKNQPLLLPFVDAAKTARSRPSIASYPEVSDAFAKEIERAFLGQATAEEALAAAEKAVNEQLG